MSENGNNSGNSEGNNEMDGNSSREKVPQEPAIVYNNIDVETELESLVKLLDGKIYKEEEIAMEELHQYLIEDDGCWALSDNFLTFVGRVLRDAAFSSTTRVHLIRILAYAALKDDVIILLHQDRRDHTLMNFANDFDKHSPEEQQAWGIFICNLFANPSPSEWLLYISEWENNNQTLSNIRITTKVTVHCVLSSCPTLKNIGTSILFNLAIKEVKTVVFDDVAVEVAMAILQFFTSSPNEEQVFKALKALVRFMEVSNDVGQFIQMIGPHPKMFAGMSERVDELVFDDVAVEVAMAILQFFTSSPNEEQVFKALKALVRFMEVSNDVGQFIQMIGPHPKMFAGMSERVDELVNFVTSKVPV